MLDHAILSPSADMTSMSIEDEWLWGWDPTPGIVSVWADATGRAVVWRRNPAIGTLVRRTNAFVRGCCSIGWTISRISASARRG